MEQWSKTDFLTKLNSVDKGAFYLFTPMCGTCQVASKMLTVVEQLLPDFPMGKADLNYMPELAETLQVESVPCLVIFENNQVQEKIYAFQSVPHLYEKLKS